MVGLTAGLLSTDLEQRRAPQVNLPRTAAVRTWYPICQGAICSWIKEDLMRRVLLLVLTLGATMLAIPTAASASTLNGLTIEPGVVNNGQSATGDLQMAFADPNA